jgi:hypothetical protein
MTDPGAPAELRGAFLAHLAGREAEAEAAYRRTFTNPQLRKATYRHLTRLLEGQHRWEESLEIARAVLAEAPDAADVQTHVATLLLGLGRYDEAGPLFEARSSLQAGQVRPKLPYPEWDGRAVRSLTLWDEQGLGDALQWLRFVPDLVARGIAVTLIIRPQIAALCANLGATIVVATGQMRIPIADAWAMLGSLPMRLGVTLDSLPGRTAYLEAPQERREKWRGRLRPEALFGVVTKGRAEHANNAQRSLPPEAAAFLLSLPGAENLLPGESALPLDDFADTAAVIEQLEMVIAVDTSIVHLAGAMGKPCWVLLPWAGEDWRWLHDGRQDSPWYPSLRLYRQPSPGDWAGALTALARDLQPWLAQRR